MEYKIFRNCFCKFFNLKIEENNDADVSFIKSNFKLYKGDLISFPESELYEMYTNLSDYDFCGLKMYSDNSAEFMLDTGNKYDARRFFTSDKFETIEDADNKLSYTISTISDKLFLNVLEKTFVELEEGKRHRYNSRIANRYMHGRIFDRIYSDVEKIETISDFFLITKSNFISLKIKSEDNQTKSIDYFNKLSDSFSFNVMYQKNYGFSEVTNINDLFNDNHVRSSTTEVNAPRKFYNPETLSYYRKAIITEDSYNKYLSFYHVLEYYFDEMFNEILINGTREKITSPDFSYKNDDSLMQLIKFFKKTMNLNRENGIMGNEKKSLTHLLEKVLDPDEILDQLQGNEIEYYKNTQVPFSKGSTIQFNSDKFYNNMTNRIYSTRNALVHSKSGQQNSRFNPFHDEDALKKEIPLIKHVAEKVLIHFSELI